MSLQWRHNERDGVSNHQCFDCLFNRLFNRISKETLKLRGYCPIVRGVMLQNLSWYKIGFVSKQVL